MLTFDAQAHAYAWRGKPVPGVTSVIRSALGDPFAGIASDVLERKRAIGNAAHLAIHLDDRGDLVEESVHELVRPYLEAWRTFRRQFEFAVLLSEEPAHQDVYGYAGTPDRIVMLADAMGVIDFKTGLPGPLAALQTAAYARLTSPTSGTHEDVRRFSLQALPSGRYKFTEYTSPANWRDFLACLAVHRLKERIAT